MARIVNRKFGRGHIDSKAEEVEFLGIESWDPDALRNQHLCSVGVHLSECESHYQEPLKFLNEKKF